MSERTLHLFDRELKAQSCISSWKLNTKNPDLLAGAWSTLSDRTWHYYFKFDLGYLCCSAVHKLWLTLAHHKKELAFASQFQERGIDEWQKVLWSNEAIF